jgi:hypothetical protein
MQGFSRVQILQMTVSDSFECFEPFYAFAVKEPLGVWVCETSYHRKYITVGIIWQALYEGRIIGITPSRSKNKRIAAVITRVVGIDDRSQSVALLRMAAIIESGELTIGMRRLLRS